MNFDYESHMVVPPEGCYDLITGQRIDGAIELKAISGITLVRKPD